MKHSDFDYSLLTYDFFAAEMDMESLYDYGEEEQDFYEESPGTRKGYPIDHRSIKVSDTL